MPDITDLEINSVIEVLKSPNLSRAKKTEEFEQKLAELTNHKYAIAVNSGTSALHLCVRSLGLKDGDEVITTPFSFIASSNCLLMEKVKPVFVDIDERTYNLKPELIESNITSKTKAILVVDVFGFPADMKRINEIAKKHNLFVIEDSCEALGTKKDGIPAGSQADVATFAFYPNKQITTGEGGAIVTSNEKFAKLCRSMRNQGRPETGEWLTYERMGYNYWIDEMSSALGLAQLSRLSEILEKRSSVAEKYLSKLKDVQGIILPHIDKSVEISWFVFTIRVNEKIREKLMKYLQENGIQCRAYFYPPIHLQDFYKEQFGLNEGDFPITEQVSKETISIPFYNNLSEEDINTVVLKLKEGVNKLK